MAQKFISSMTTGNSILDGFSPSLRDAIVSEAHPCQLPLKTVLLQRGRVPNNLVFLTSGMASLVITMSNGGASEVGMLGRETMTGVSYLLGSDTSQAECIIQIAGEGLKVPRQHLVHLFNSSHEFAGQMLQLAQVNINISAQLSACNLQHQAEARFARWLLTASDRINSDALMMTQELFAEMIGTRRTTVSVIVGALQKRHLIRQKRGTISILDRPGLTAAACECYEVCRQWTYDRAMVAA